MAGAKGEEDVEDLPGCWFRGCLTPWLDQQASHLFTPALDSLLLLEILARDLQVAGHCPAILVPPLSRLGSAGRAGAALLSNLDSLEVKSEP